MDLPAGRTLGWKRRRAGCENGALHDQENEEEEREKRGSPAAAQGAFCRLDHRCPATRSSHKLGGGCTRSGTPG